MSDLLPCPICHEQPVRNGRGGKGGVLCNGEPAHRVQTYGADQAEADAAWNTRMTPPQDSVSDVEREARFLCARLREFEREGVTEDSFREWNGHVSPSLSRLEGLLDGPINKIGEDAK